VSRRTLIAIAVGAALLLAGALIAVSAVGGGDDEESAATTLATAQSGGSVPEPTIKTTSLAVLSGVPRQGNVLGKANAPVTMIEYADLQCPFCARFSKETLPVLVKRWVKPGKVKIGFRPIAFLGDDSEKALRFLVVAQEKGKLWEATELLYENQGTENTGWVTDGLLRAIARKIGLDPDATIAEAEKVPASKIAALNQLGANDGVQGTPTFLMARTGGTPITIGTGALGPDAFTPAIEAALTS
jgi:protein-disulfide isomerase